MDPSLDVTAGSRHFPTPDRFVNGIWLFTVLLARRVSTKDIRTALAMTTNDQMVVCQYQGPDTMQISSNPALHGPYPPLGPALDLEFDLTPMDAVLDAPRLGYDPPGSAFQPPELVYDPPEAACSALNFNGMDRSEKRKASVVEPSGNRKSPLASFPCINNNTIGVESWHLDAPRLECNHPGCQHRTPFPRLSEYR